MSLRSIIKRVLARTQDDSEAEPAPRHERREAGRERHHETGEPAWEESDRLDEPPGVGKPIQMRRPKSWAGTDSPLTSQALRFDSSSTSGATTTATFMG